MIVGCYTLDLYCENDRQYPDGTHDFYEFPHQYTGETHAECNRQARKQGWKLTRDKKAFCPKCSRRTKRAPDSLKAGDSCPPETVKVQNLLPAVSG